MILLNNQILKEEKLNLKLSWSNKRINKLNKVMINFIHKFSFFHSFSFLKLFIVTKTAQIRKLA